ncbi:RidA family protein [Chelativorans xinjiangense]|uniref:RidA family protein n=1 Tax=Chelativorans xinjiangense TaxID=2681485 RepID=UPI00135A4FC1|nr:RidA family protein [Chelativorans xinjiangense]
MIERFETSEKSSRVVKYNGVVYLSGLTPDDPDDDVAAQTRQILRKIDHFLERAGTDKSRLLTGIVWTREIENIPEINRIWEEWVPEGCAPARTCARATPARHQCLLEITVTAAAGAE